MADRGAAKGRRWVPSPQSIAICRYHTILPRSVARVCGVRGSVSILSVRVTFRSLPRRGAHFSPTPTTHPQLWLVSVHVSPGVSITSVHTAHTGNTATHSQRNGSQPQITAREKKRARSSSKISSQISSIDSHHSPSFSRPFSWWVTPSRGRRLQRASLRRSTALAARMTSLH